MFWRSCSASASVRIEPFSSRSLSFVLASISSRCLSVRYSGCGAELLMCRWRFARRGGGEVGLTDIAEIGVQAGDSELCRTLVSHSLCWAYVSPTLFAYNSVSLREKFVQIVETERFPPRGPRLSLFQEAVECCC